MNNGRLQIFIFFLWTMPTMIMSQQNVGIGNTNPHPSALLDLTSTDKGVLIPRMTTAERLAITSPSVGLLVFDTSTLNFWFYSGGVWVELRPDLALVSGAGISITGNTLTNTGDLNGTDDINIGTAAGGDITGTYPNPTIAANAIGSSEITDATIGAIDMAPGVIPTSLPPSGAAGGDLSGSYPNPGVTKIQGNPVVATPPTNQQILKWNGSQWAPAPDDGVTTAGAGLSITGNTVTNTGDLNGADDINIGTAAGGDLTGTYPNPTVAANAIGSSEIIDAAIGAIDMAPGVIPTTLPPSGSASGDLTGTYPNPTVAANAIGSSEITDATIGAIDMAPGVIPTTLPPNGSAGGDLTGTYPNPTVAANAIGSSEITDATIGAIDMAPGVIPTTLPPSGSAGGDLSGSYPNPGVTKIQGNPVVATAPTNQQILKWNGSQWAPAADDGVTTAGAGLSITGNTVTNTGDLNGTDDINIGTAAGGDLTGSYPNPSVAANAVGSAEISDGSILHSDLATDVIDSTNIVNGSVIHADLADNAVDSAKIEDGTVTALDLTSGPVTDGKLLTADGLGNVTWENPAVQTLIADADGDTKIQVEESADEDIIRFDLAGVEKMVVRQNAYGQERLEFSGGPSWPSFSNTAVGKDALLSNDLYGYNNTAFGRDALKSNTSGGDNTAVGSYALKSNSGGSNNTAVGSISLWNNTTGLENTAVGNFSLHFNTTGADNTANGFRALENNTTGWLNCAFGSYSLIGNTTGVFNTAVGASSLSNTTGSENTAIGYQALGSANSASKNTGIGRGALFSNSTYSNNTAIGYFAMRYSHYDWSTSGDGNNTAIGAEALYGYYPPNGNIGTLNSAVGAAALHQNSSGSFNVANGASAMYNNTTGSYNTFNGYYAGFNGNHNQSTLIGASIDISTNRTNVSALGYGILDAQCTADNQVLLGNTAVTDIRAQVTGITAYSDARFKTNVSEDVKGLDFITRLNPVTYNENPEVLHQIWGTPDSVLSKLDHTDIKSQRFIGFLAQDVEQAAKDCGFEFPGVDVPQSDKEVYALRYVDFIMPVVKSIQEQQALILQLQSENRELKLNAAKFEKEIELIKAFLAKSN